MHLYIHRLVQVPLEEFQRLNQFWYGTKSGSTDKHDLARVNYTITSIDYESLLIKFRENKFGTKVSFFSGREWNRINVEELTLSKIREIAMTLGRAPKRPGNLELYFEPYSDPDLEEPQVVRARFGELEGKIFCYEISLPRNCWPTMQWSRTPDLWHKNTIGLWVPKDQNK